GAKLVDTRAVASPDGGTYPANKPADVTLVGKIGISDEEWSKVRGDFDKINALLKEKTGKDGVLKKQDVASSLTSQEFINKKIAAALAVTLTTQQFLQTEGNEEAIRVKQDVMQELKDKHGPPPEEKAGRETKPQQPAKPQSYVSYEDKK